MRSIFLLYAKQLKYSKILYLSTRILVIYTNKMLNASHYFSAELPNSRFNLHPPVLNIFKINKLQHFI